VQNVIPFGTYLESGNRLFGFPITNIVRKIKKTMKKDVRVQEVGHIFLSDFLSAKITKLSDKKKFSDKIINFNLKITLNGSRG
jgi:hypothetical protein